MDHADKTKRQWNYKMIGDISTENENFEQVVRMEWDENKNGRRTMTVQKVPARIVAVSEALLEIAKRWIETAGTHESCPKEHDCLLCATVCVIAKSEEK